MVLARALPRVAIQQTRAFAAVRSKHTLPPLPYAYDVSHPASNASAFDCLLCLPMLTIALPLPRIVTCAL